MRSRRASKFGLPGGRFLTIHLLLVLGLMLPFPTMAQYQPTSSNVSFTVGMVSSHLFSDTLATLPHNALSIGFQFVESLKGKYYLKGGARFTTRGYNSDVKESRLRNRYLDLEANVLRELLPGLRLELGGAVHVLFSANFSYIEPALSYTKQTSTPLDRTTYIDGFAGLELRLQKGVELGARYYPALNDRQSGGLVVQLAISMDEPWSTGELALEKQIARENIHKLREGVILLRLKTLQKSIASMREHQMPLGAAELEQRVKDQNKELMEAFRTSFDFCPVYFFYSDDSKDVLERRYGGRVFDAKGQPVDTVMLHSSNIFFADTGPLEADTSTHYYQYELVQDGDFSRKRIRREYAGQAMGFGALVIKDKHMVPLARPLPYYVKTWGHYKFLRSPEKFVALLDQKLYDFYRQSPKVNTR